MERMSVAARLALREESMQATVARKNLTQMAVAQMLSSRECLAPRAEVSWSLKCPLVNSRLTVVVSHQSGQVVCAQ
jgi:hypothetical protein